MENIIASISNFFQSIVKWFQDLVAFIRKGNDNKWQFPEDPTNA